MKPLGTVLWDKMIFEYCIFDTYFLAPWPAYDAIIRNRLNNVVEIIPVKFGLVNVDVWRTTVDDGRRPVTLAHPERIELEWAKTETLAWNQNWISSALYLHGTPIISAVCLLA